MTALALGGSPSPLWYATRATGTLAMLLLTASVVLGLLATVRFTTPGLSRVITSGLHRNVSLLILVFLGIHILTAELDTFAPVGWLAIVIPFASSYRPLWLGLGTVASDLLVALVVTSLLRARIGYRWWRAVHWASYACWPVALVHGLGTGTDTRLTWLLGVDALSVAAVLATLWWRLAAARPANPWVRPTSIAASVALPVAGVVWLALGPLAPGWAARSGTPAALLGHSASSGSRSASQGSASTGQSSIAGIPSLPLTASLKGSVSESRPDAAGQVTVQIRATASGTPGTVVGIRLQGTPDSSDGITMTSSQVTWGPPSDPSRYRGQITALEGEDIHAAVSGSGSTTLELNASLHLSGKDASGTLHVTREQPGGSESSESEEGGQ